MRQLQPHGQRLRRLPRHLLQEDRLELLLVLRPEANSLARPDPGPGPAAQAAAAPYPPSFDEDDIQASVASVRAAQAGPRLTPTVSLRIRQPGRSTFDIQCTPDTWATHTVISADIVARRSLFTRHSSVKLYSAKEWDRMESSRATTFSAAVICDDGRHGPRRHIDALVSADLSNEILISWRHGTI